MNSVTFTNLLQKSRIECEEYFPLKVIFDSSIGENRFIGFYGGKYNLLEFSVNRKTNLINKLQIVICKDYKIIETDLELPHPEKDGSICLSNSQHNDCDNFILLIYTNSIKINISKNNASKFYAMGQVLFGVDDNNDIVTLIVTNLNADEIAHTIFELQAE